MNQESTTPSEFPNIHASPPIFSPEHALLLVGKAVQSSEPRYVAMYDLEHLGLILGLVQDQQVRSWNVNGPMSFDQAKKWCSQLERPCEFFYLDQDGEEGLKSVPLH